MLNYFFLYFCRIVFVVHEGFILCFYAKFTTSWTSFLQEMIQPFIDSIISMEAEQIFETTRDAGGARVVEAFLNSNASGKIKRKLVVKYVDFIYISL